MNTFGIDVQAKYFAAPETVEELKRLLLDDRFKDLPRIVLGGGSNVLFTQNYKGIAIKNNLMGIELIKEDTDFYYVKAGAGVIWHDLVTYCVNNNYGGLENLSLIPGSVGAGPIQNIGAYGVELKDYLFEVEAMKVMDQSMVTFDNAACNFAYRESVFKRALKGQYIITSVTYKLLKKPQLNTNYGAIENELKAMGLTVVSIAAISKAVCNIRNSKLPNPEVIGNAGSFFKNPEIPVGQYQKLKKRFADLVAYEIGGGMMKLAAGWMIEQCGWKGKRVGDAGVHKLQALVLVNYGDASGAELIALSDQIIQSVKVKFEVDLEREVNIV